jgi:hypothetical protein
MFMLHSQCSVFVQDDTSVKLINLHHYEKRRRVPAPWATRLANVANVHADDHAIRVASRSDGSVAVTWVDFERPEPQPWLCDPDAKAFLDAFLKIGEPEIVARLEQRTPPRPPCSPSRCPWVNAITFCCSSKFRKAHAVEHLQIAQFPLMYLKYTFTMFCIYCTRSHWGRKMRGSVAPLC